MHFRFIHAADIHLGFEQYSLPARENDFAQAYLDMVQHAIDVQADFVIIAGDLFHKANADAWTLKQATHGLTLLREKKIPVIAIEGNHDSQNYRKHLSWLEYLCDLNLVSLLSIDISGGRRAVVPFDPTERRGTWIDVAGARIYGIKYYGALTGQTIDDVRKDILPGPDGYTILMLHAGLEGQVPHMHGGLTPAQIEPLHHSVDYLALGHIHKQLYKEYDWVFNPSSTEVNSTEEMDWPHGFFDVQVDTESSPKHTVQFVTSPHLRAFCRISLRAEGCDSVEEFVRRAERHVMEHADLPKEAVIELHLSGVAQFRRQDVPIENLKAKVEARFSPLIVRLRNNLAPPGVVSVREIEGMTRLELEQRVIKQLVYQQAAFRDSATPWSKLILDVKNMASEKDLPASIVDRVRAVLQQMDTPEHESVAPEQPSPDPVSATAPVNLQLDLGSW